MTESTRWIPISERLPNSRRFVLILIDGVDFVGYYTEEYKKWRWCNPVEEMPRKVTHWQELPQPTEEQPQ